MSWKFLASCDIVQLTLMEFAIIILIVRKKQSLTILHRLGKIVQEKFRKGNELWKSHFAVLMTV